MWEWKLKMKNKVKILHLWHSGSLYCSSNASLSHTGPLNHGKILAHVQTVAILMFWDYKFVHRHRFTHKVLVINVDLDVSFCSYERTVSKLKPEESLPAHTNTSLPLPLFLSALLLWLDLPTPWWCLSWGTSVGTVETLHDAFLVGSDS